MDPVEQFAARVGDPDPPVAELLALVAATGRPDVDPAAVVARLDAVAAEAREGIGPDAPAPASVCGELFGRVGFVGARDDYYDPRNSLLDQVLARRRGQPIMLAVVAIEVGHRLGVELVGVGMPGHFLVGVPVSARSPGPRGAGRWFDAFDGGRELDEAGCAAVFAQVHGSAASFDVSMLAPVGAHEIVGRVMNNLQAARSRAGDRSGVADVVQLRASAAPAAVAPRHQLASALVAAGRFDEAATVHDDLARLEPDQELGHRRRALELRARLN